MKFLIAGLGSIGRRHFRNLRALGEQDIILYRTRKSTLPDDELAGFETFTDLDTALAQKPDAVFVSNPTALHMDVALPAAQAGIHLFLEKPVAGSLDERVEALQAAVSRSGSRVLVGFQFRFHPTLQKAAELIHSGALGQVLTFRAHWGEYVPNWHPWEDYRQTYTARADLGGGVIATLTHPLDYLRWLLGEVTALWSFNGHISPLEMDVEDVAEMGLRLANGAIGSVHVNYVQRPPAHRLEIIGTAGALRWDNADGVLHFYHMPQPFGAWQADPPAAELTTFAPPEGFERNAMFLAQTRHFIEVVRGAAQPVCTLQDGIRALQLVEAARQSNLQGKVITLP